MYSYDFYADGLYYDINPDGTTVTTTIKQKITSYNPPIKYSGDIVVPEIVSNNGISYTVTAIGAQTFYTSSDITSISIPHTITKIEANAFNGCSGIKSITIPQGVTDIGDKAFYKCTGLTSITLPDSLNTISKEAFYGCTGLTSIVIPDAVTTIGDNAFYDCTNLKSATIGTNLASYGSRIFYNTPITNVVWNAKNCKYSSNPVNYIGGGFYQCDNISSVTIGDYVESIPEYLFYGKTKLETLNIGTNLNTIGTDAFSGCTGIKNISWNAIKFPDCIETPFYDSRSSIKQFSIGNYVEYIPSYLCNGMTEISSITIPKSVTDIGNYAFNGCSGLLKIYARASLPPNINNYTFGTYTYENATLYVYENSKDSYTGHKIWQNFMIINTIAGGEKITINLIVEYPESAVIKYQNFYNSTAKFCITPVAGWSVNTISFNDEDITQALDENGYYTTPVLTEDSKIKIVTVKNNDETTDITDILSSPIKVYANKSIVTIIGAEESSEVSICDMWGKIVYTGTDKQITIESKGIYLLNVNSQIFKFIISE